MLPSPRKGTTRREPLAPASLTRMFVTMSSMDPSLPLARPLTFSSAKMNSRNCACASKRCADLRPQLDAAMTM